MFLRWDMSCSLLLCKVLTLWELSGPNLKVHVTEGDHGGLQKVIDKELWDAPVEFMPPQRDVPTPGNE